MDRYYCPTKDGQIPPSQYEKRPVQKGAEQYQTVGSLLFQRQHDSTGLCR
jgi:hypothetical protein